eukprot:TRINITY_DN30794_c0_g1_i1.p1 TRINITY_DN30794_c0_g1~~TRINITY_DN30794_c0_g1_i1.p1  ORF type:complete len:633 (+),score=121.59 TRINITY_DN30794_c0_g1_i1:48-1901(+)
MLSGRRVPTPATSIHAWQPIATQEVQEVEASTLREEPVNAHSPLRQRTGGKRQPRAGAENAAPSTLTPPKFSSPVKLSSPGNSSPNKENDEILGKRKLGDKTQTVQAASKLAPLYMRIGMPADAIDSEVAGFVKALSETGGKQELANLVRLRQVLASRVNPPIDEIFKAGALPLLVAALCLQPEQEATQNAVQHEAAWCLAQLAIGNSQQTRQVVEAGAMVAALELLSSPSMAENSELCDRCLQLLANLAGDEDSWPREQLFAAGIIGALGSLFGQMPSFSWNEAERTCVLRTFTELMCGLCRGTPPPALEEVDCCFDFFSQVLQGADDPEMLSSAVWGLCYLLEGAPDDPSACARAARLLSAGFEADKVPAPTAVHPVLAQVARCMRTCGDLRSPLPSAALRLAGILVSLSEPGFTTAVIAAGGLRSLHASLADTSAPVQARCDAAWVLANMAAGTPDQAQSLARETGLLEALCDGVERGAPSVRQECAWAIMNFLKQGPDFVPRLDGRRVLQLAPILLNEDDIRVQRAVLESVEVVLNSVVAKELNLTGAAHEYGLVRRMQELSQSEGTVGRQASFIVKSWFNQDHLSLADLDMEEPSQEGVNSPRRRAAFKFGA